MAFEFWKTLKELVIANADLSPVTFVTHVGLALALSYVVWVMFGSSPHPKHQRSSNCEEEVVKDMDEVPMDTTSNQLTVASSPPWDVFLSFYGKDTRRNFISNLYYALDQAGIVTFRDDPALEKGEEISSGLLKAIQNSKMFVVVISENYARSSWCLDELVEILRCKRTKTQVVPVFYYVDPSDLRHQKGCFGVALKSHKKRHSVPRIEKWKSALAEIADLSGYHLEKDAKESEADIIQKIVENVVPQASTKSLHLETCLFGIDLAVEEIYQKLSMDSNDVHALGICGMGGIGKTTLAKAFFNKYHHKFDISCFMENVKQISQVGSPLLPLLQQLLIQLLRKKDFEVRDVESALRKLKEILSSKKALIVMDDLDQSSYSEFLVRICKFFSHGSRVIITARDANLLNQLKVEMSKVDTYMVKHLDEINSLELFSHHAFKKPMPPRNYIALSERFVRYAGGLPLALKVLGSSLCGRTDMSFWKAKLEKVKKIPVEDIHKILQLSYDELGDETEKAIFLDIVFFFIGKNKEEAVLVLNSCGLFPDAGIPILVERCLVTIDANNKLQMHNLIQDMGRKVIHEESKHGNCQRLYLDQEETWQAMQKLEETDKIEGLVINLTRSTNKYCSAEIFERLPNLRLLKLVDVHDIKGNFKTSFHELRFISWHGCPWRHLPSAIHLQNLVSFDMPFSRFETLWKVAKLPSLCHLNLEGCKYLKKLPESIGQLPSLRHLNLEGCKYLKKLPESIGQLPSLRHLNLEGCKYLKKLPESIGQLTTLHHFNVRDCVNLKRLPKPIIQLNTLGRLDMNGCSNLKLLPEQLGEMKGLHIVNASFTAIEQLPDSITQLKKLVYLKLLGCEKLTKLPEQFGNMEGLETFDASWSAIEQLPDSFSNLLNLDELLLFGCKNLTSLPNSIWKLKSLQILDLSECSQLNRLPEQLGEMKGLHTVNASFTAIEELPDSIGNMEGLGTLDLRNCSQLKRLPEQLGKMQCLEELDASDTAIEELPDSIGLLRSIRSMDFSGCEKLTYAPNSILNLTSLETLYLNREDIIKIELLDAVNDMKLEDLDLSCNIREWLPRILSFTSLRKLHLQDECGSLSPSKPFSFVKLFNLNKLVLTNCTSHGSSFPELPLNLKRLEVHNHASLEQVPDLSYLKQLEDMSITECCSLQSLQKLPPHLSSLTVCDCTSLQHLPDLSILRDLLYLKVTGNGSTLKVSLKDSLQGGRDEWSSLRATLQNREIAEWFDYKSRGSTVCFDVPPNLGDNFAGVAFWVVYHSINESRICLGYDISNITEGTHKYRKGHHVLYNGVGDVRSIIHCERGDEISIKSGDKIMVSFQFDRAFSLGIEEMETKVKMCGAHIILKTPL